MAAPPHQDKPNSSKIYFIGLENPSNSLKSMKESLEKLLDISCPKCDTFISQACKCKILVSEFEKTFQKFIFPTVPSLTSVLDCLKQLGTGKTVCGKILTSKSIGFKCLDCELDPTCIICQECYEKSDHKSHRTIQQNGGAGCCDCGDKEAWRPEGFCIDHQGFKGNEIEKIQSLPEEFRNNYFDNFRMLFYLFFLGCEDFFTRCGMTNASTKMIKIWRLIMNLLKIVNKNDNFILNALLFDLLRKGFENPSYKLSHECGNHENLYLSNNKNKCDCSILENLFRFNLILDHGAQKEMMEMCINLFGFYDFKQYLIMTYSKMFPFFFRNAKKRPIHMSENQHSTILDLNVQLFTSDELAKKLIENEIFEGFLDFLVKEFYNIRAKPENYDPMRTRLQMHHIENISLKPSLCQLLCKKVIFFDKFFEMLFALNQIASYDIEVYKDRAKIEQNFDFLDLELMMLGIMVKILKIGLKEMEVKDREALLDYLISSILKFLRKEEEDSNDSSSFHIPVQRVLSLLLAVKLYYNKELIEKKALMKFLMTMNFETIKQLECFLIRQFCIMANLFVFLKEIQKNFWKEYCNLLNAYPSVHSKNKYPFYDLDNFLFQILMNLLSENEEILLEYFLKKNKNLKKFLTEISLINNESEKKLEFPSGETIDLLEELINILLTSISPFNLPIINIWNFLDSDPEIEKTKKETLEKVIEGILMQTHALDIKTIKLKAYNFIHENYKLEQFVEEIASFDKKSKMFKLKCENPENFNAFIFIRDSTFMYEASENISNRFKEKEILSLETQKKDFLSPISHHCLELISKDLFIIIIKLLSQSQTLMNHVIFLKKILKLFYQLLSFFIEKDQKHLYLILQKESTLRNSFIFLQNNNAFLNINLSIEAILKKLDQISLQIPQLKQKTPSEEAKFNMHMKKEVFHQKQKELKEKFLAQQAKFLLKNQEFLEEEFKVSHHQVICAICKEEVNEKMPYGQLAHFSKSNIYKYARYQQFLRLRLEENDKGILEFLDGIDWKSDFFNEIKDQYCFSSCFHYLHLQCYKDFIKGNSSKPHYLLDIFEFKCPLCHRLSNLFIPFGSYNNDENYEVKSWKKDIEIDIKEMIGFKGMELEKLNYQSNDEFFDDIMKIKCTMEDHDSENVVDILENALISVVESLQINGFNYFLNKQLMIYKNLLFLYRIYSSNQTHEFPNEKNFLSKRKEKIADLLKLLINEKQDLSFFTKNMEITFINYAILSFIFYQWRPEDLYRHLSSIFEYTLFWIKIQFLFKKTYKANNYAFSNKLFEKDKDFIKIYLHLMQTFLSISFLIFSFDETILRDLNTKSFLSDEEELFYLKSLLPIHQSSFFQTANSLYEENLTKSLSHYNSLKTPKEQILFLYESLKIDQDLYLKLYELEQRFSDLMNLFSGRKCDLCHNYSKHGELSLCLICGATICNRFCDKDLIEQKGNLNVHSVENHCGNSVFISFHKCEIFLICSPKNFMEKSLLYTDKYGQSIKLKSADWGCFVLSSEEYNLLKEILVKNSVSQEILYRSLKHNIYYKPNAF